MKKLLLLVLVLSIVGAPAMAARKRRVVKKPQPQSESKGTAKLSDVESKKPRTSQAFQAWLRDMKKRVGRANARPNQIVAVAAVRGDEAPDAPPLYWKGRKAEGNVAETELKEFEGAIDTAMTGNPAAAKQKLQAFVVAYPKSSMVADANETLARLDASVAP